MIDDSLLGNLQLFYSITVEGVLAYFSHTVSNLILVTHAGIVLTILRLSGVQFTETFTEVKNWQLSCLFISNLVNSITVDGMSAYFSHTVLSITLVSHGSIVLPILGIVGVQITEIATEVKNWQLSCLLTSNLVNQITVDDMSAYVSHTVLSKTLATQGGRYSAPIIMDSKCAVY